MTKKRRSYRYGYTVGVEPYTNDIKNVSQQEADAWIRLNPQMYNSLINEDSKHKTLTNKAAHMNSGRKKDGVLRQAAQRRYELVRQFIIDYRYEIDEEESRAINAGTLKWLEQQRKNLGTTKAYRAWYEQCSGEKF